MKKVISLIGLVGSLYATDVNYADSVYVGADGGFLSFGGDSLNIETIDKGTSTEKKTFSDVSGTPLSLKVGFQHFNGNRVEVYAKYNDIDTSGGTISTDSYGVNYLWGFSSLSDNGKLMPYILVGGGTGTADSSKIKQMDNNDVTEINLGIGMHYQFNKSLYGSFSYINNTMIFDNVKDSSNKNLDVSDVTTNTLHVGLSYHF